MNPTQDHPWRTPVLGYLAAVLSIAAVTAAGVFFRAQVNQTTVALAMLLAVLLVAMVWGSWAGRFGAVLGMLCYNFFFLPPIYKLTIADPQNWIALAAFFITASTVGHLSTRTEQHAEEIRDLYNNAPCGYHSLDKDGTIVRINDTELSWLGYRHDEVVGKMKFENLLSPKSQKAFEEEFSRLKAEGSVFNVELDLIRKSGSILPVLLNATAATDRYGSYVMSRSMVVDITDRKQGEERLRRIYRAQRALSFCNQALVRATEEASLLQQICDIIVAEAGYRLCWVGVAEDNAEKDVRPVARAGADLRYMESLKVTWSDSALGQGPTGSCIRTRQTVTVRDIATDPRMAPWRDAALKHGYASSAAIPLIVGSDVFGALTIYAAEPEAFGAEEVRLLSELAGDLTFGIETLRARIARAKVEEEVRALNAYLEQRVAARTAELQAANAKIEKARERETEIGFRIQQTLLLDQPPTDIPELQVAALTFPSDRIDGDFYIFIKHLDQTRSHVLDVIVGDVMGKGIPGALLGAATKSVFLKALNDLLALSTTGALPEPADVVMLANSRIVRHLIELESFVTLCYARLDTRRQVIQLVDCGHPGTIHLHGSTGLCNTLQGDNLPLGVREGELYSQISAPYETGDSLLLYSDGITEARNPAKDLFGTERLEQCLRTNSDLAPDALTHAIRQCVLAFSQTERLSDDLTCVAIRITEAERPVASAETDILSDLKQLRRAREFVREFCANLPGSPMEETSTGALELAVNEAASNIMKHAYHGRTDQSIHLEAEAFDDYVAIRLHHSGDPFDPASARPPALDGSRESGFGAYIIAQSMDEVRYYRDERGRNCVSLKKKR